MRVQHIGYRIRGFYRIAAFGHLWEMTPKDAQQRLKILRFWDKHGLAATMDAFGVSRRTLFRWQARLRAEGGNPAALAAKPCAPKHKRTPEASPRLVAEIRRLRTLHPNLGKDKQRVLLVPWCAQHAIPLPSSSTIGRIIARAPDKMRTSPARIDRLGRPKPVRRLAKTRKPKDLKAAPMTLWTVDTIERVRDGMRRYLLTLIDPVSAIAFAVALPSKHARHTAAAAQALAEGLLPNPGGKLMFLSDNGSEFKGAFDQTLQRLNLTHYWTYPKNPKMNAHAERFNRTLQEPFVDSQSAKGTGRIQ
jgi:transposase InsO family protein